ncbi:hypothetical protein [Burkholderia pseudomallei]|uniref:hypothetical protein n=1 Tax=Burkholderia pseudomallei TaxID=28450 RepID=UPI000A1A08C4|nr:hypothetical protein [Burkholderia pseudomallei]ARL25471.1 hypothetical protein BOC47_24160 [Burkholderia pseudomallei]
MKPAQRCLVCGAVAPDSDEPRLRDWDWFTGYFDRTAMFCPKHRDSGMRHLLYEYSQRAPAAPGQNWSLDRAARDLKLTVG